MLDFDSGFDFDISRVFAEKLETRYPFLSCEVIGRSYTGRGIFAFSIGNKLNQVLYVGGTHGCEYLTSMVLYKFIDTVCEKILFDEPLWSVNFSALTNKFGMAFIPCLNPDGTEIALKGISGAGNMRHITEKIPCDDYTKWNANAVGVDLNHNFDASWRKERLLEIENGIIAAAPRQFGGYSAESEPETRAVTTYCRRKKFRSLLSLHSQGEEILYKYENLESPKSAMMAKIMASCCGYTLKENEGLASHAGMKDWFITEFRKPAFTFEIGKGENPLPFSDLDEIYSTLEETLALFALM